MIDTSVIKTVAVLDTTVVRATSTKEESQFQFDLLTKQLATASMDTKDYSADIKKYSDQVLAFTNLRNQTPAGQKANDLDEMIAAAKSNLKSAERSKAAQTVTEFFSKQLEKFFFADEVTRMTAYLTELEAKRPTLPSA